MRRLLAGAALAAALGIAATATAAAAKRPYLVRSFPGVRAGSGTGDRASGRGAELWFPSSVSTAQGGLVPHAVRLLEDGNYADWTLDREALESAPAALRVDPKGKAWVLVPLPTRGTAFLYSLDPGSADVTRYAIPFLATDLAVDPAQASAWLAGPGILGRLQGNLVDTWSVPHATGAATRVDPVARRLWLAADDGSLVAFRIDTAYESVYADFGAVLAAPAVDEAGVVWGLDDSGRLFSFDPALSRRESWPVPLAPRSWSRPGAAGGLVALCAVGGPHLLLLEPAALAGGQTATLATPAVTGPQSTSYIVSVSKGMAEAAGGIVTPLDRVEYRETVSGRTLFRDGGVSYAGLLWSDGSEILAAGDPVQWWRPMDATKPFATQAVLPVVAEVRPADPVANFRTEVTLANVDADPDVALLFTTSAGAYTASAKVPAGTTLFWPDAVAALRALGAAVPEGAWGTLTATFGSGRGTMAARVYTLFGDDTRLPKGATTGLGFPSVDPAARLLVEQATLDGLKSTPDFRTNVALANVCGAAGDCATVTLEVDFFDDATGRQAGARLVDVAPHAVVQLDAPLPALGLSGESFSIRVKRASGGPTAFDAYATVISNRVQDASFLRAEPVADSAGLALPVVTDAQGIGTRFTSEASITNAGEEAATADVTFTSARTGRRVSDVLELAPGIGVRWPNAVDHFRQLAPSQVDADDYGPVTLVIRGAASLFASSRTFASNGTGLAFAGLDPWRERAVAVKRVYGLRQGPAVRTNLALVHLGTTTADAAAPITLSVVVRDASGAAVGAPILKTLVPGELFQVTKVLETLGASGDGFYATVERTAGVDAFDAYATIIDELSSDPTFMRAE